MKLHGSHRRNGEVTLYNLAEVLKRLSEPLDAWTARSGRPTSMATTRVIERGHVRRPSGSYRNNVRAFTKEF